MKLTEIKENNNNVAVARCPAHEYAYGELQRAVESNADARER